MNPFTTHGAFSWAELLGADADAAVAYYSALFGWVDDPMPMGEHGLYHTMKAGPLNACGIMLRPDETIPPMWTYYITVSDIDQIAEAVVDAGGTLVVPVTEAPGVGRFCGFLDPQGAYLSAISYHDPSGMAHLDDFSDSFRTPGLFSWIELRTPSVEQAVDFYTSVFGWTVTKEAMPMGPYHVIQVGKDGFGGILSPPAPDVPAHWGGYVTVGDVDAVEKAARASGATITIPAFDIDPVGRMVHMSDPQGAALAAIKYAEPQNDSDGD